MAGEKRRGGRRRGKESCGREAAVDVTDQQNKRKTNVAHAHKRNSKGGRAVYM